MPVAAIPAAFTAIKVGATALSGANAAVGLKDKYDAHQDKKDDATSGVVDQGMQKTQIVKE